MSFIAAICRTQTITLSSAKTARPNTCDRIQVEVPRSCSANITNIVEYKSDWEGNTGSCVTEAPGLECDRVVLTPSMACIGDCAKLLR
jgi:hypothetical protein